MVLTFPAGRGQFLTNRRRWVCLVALGVGLSFPERFPPRLQLVTSDGPGPPCLVFAVPRNDSNGDVCDAWAKGSPCTSSCALAALSTDRETEALEGRPHPQGHRVSVWWD